jgi:C-terminal processing protease CtpA/Prc
MKNFKAYKEYIFSFLLVGLVFAAGLCVGKETAPVHAEIVNVANTEVSEDLDVDSADFELFWDVWALIGQKHIDADEVSSEDRIYGAIKGLVASLDDPYS